MSISVIFFIDKNKIFKKELFMHIESVANIYEWASHVAYGLWDNIEYLSKFHHSFIIESRRWG